MNVEVLYVTSMPHGSHDSIDFLMQFD